MRGNSFANGNSCNNGPWSPRRWGAGWQAPVPPGGWWPLIEGEQPG